MTKLLMLGLLIAVLVYPAAGAYVASKRAPGDQDGGKINRT